MVAGKSFEDVKDIAGGEWTGQKDFEEIVKAIEHRERVEAEVDMENVYSYGTPTGTQNPEPPTSGVPLVGDSIRTVLPAIVSGEDPPTPTPSAIFV